MQHVVVEHSADRQDAEKLYGLLPRRIDPELVCLSHVSDYDDGILLKFFNSSRRGGGGLSPL